MAITISGTEVILADLEKMMSLGDEIDDVLVAAVIPIAQKMKQLAPVKSGRLRGAIGIGAPRNSRRGRTVTVGIHKRDFGDGEYYPAFVEYGHGGPRPAPPHPFIRPAYDLKKDDAWAAIKQAVIDQMKTKGL